MGAAIAAETWSGRRLERLFDRVAAEGAIDDIAVGLRGPVAEPDPEAVQNQEGPILANAPYRIVYSSSAASDPVLFDGELQLSLANAEADAWQVAWSKQLLWPGVSQAAGFTVVNEWLARGAILDRRGRKLAAGRPESRRYPYGTLAGSTIGHIEPFASDAEDDVEPATTPAGGESEDAAPGPVAGDPVGASGLELALDEQLAGRPASELVVVDRRGDPLETVGQRAGERGTDVKTTLDIAVQGAAQEAYGATTGGAIVMDPATGDLLAVVSSSPFDPGDYVGVAGVQPFNRALSGLYPPGSSMKVVTASAALEEDVVTANTTLSGPAEYQGVRNFESGAFGSLDFATAVKQSVNTAFAQVAQDLGPKHLAAYADAFGFNRAPEMPLGAATSSFPFPEDDYDLMWGAIGQAQVLATPLQMATVAATVANDGRRMEPRILLRDAQAGTRVISRASARTMTRLMEGVVEEGTGVRAAVPGLQVAGKTGTAEVDVDGERKNHAWFISFAPSSAPKVAVAVVSELGGVGGEVAAPLAGRILSAILPLVR